MVDREEFIQRMGKLRDDMQAAFFKEFEGQCKTLLAECPDIGLVYFNTYVPYFNDGEDCVWSINAFSTFIQRDGMTPQGEYPEELYFVAQSALPDEVKGLYRTTASCEGYWATTAYDEAQELGYDDSVFLAKLEEQHDKIHEFIHGLSEDLKFFIPDDVEWIICNHNGEFMMQVKEYKDHE